MISEAVVAIVLGLVLGGGLIFVSVWIPKRYAPPRRSDFEWQEEPELNGLIGLGRPQNFEGSDGGPLPDLAELQVVCTCPSWPHATDDECPRHNQAWRG